MKICIVIPAYNEKENLAELCRQITKFLKQAKIGNYQILLVDDGSTDGTLDEIKRIAKQDQHISYLSFSRNFGHQAALRAGIAYGEGDAIITMDADLQHPPELIPELIRQWQQGYDIVYTRRQDDAGISLFKRVTSRLFYRLLNRLSGLAIEVGAADFRLIDAQVAGVIKELPESDLFLRGFISWSGFKTYAIDYRPSPRLSGKSKYSFKQMIALALHGFTQFSIKPLRLANFLGFIFALTGAVYGIYAIWQHVQTHGTISGWTSVIVSILLIGGAQLIILGIIGEYLGRTFMQTKQRPDYIIREKGRPTKTTP
jgi:glycosyltransferase involved in cell wall biosynthesis